MNFSQLKSEFIVELESHWIEDNYIEEYKTSANTLLLHIQMELCSMTLQDVIERLNEELNRKLDEIITPITSAQQVLFIYRVILVYKRVFINTTLLLLTFSLL